MATASSSTTRQHVAFSEITGVNSPSTTLTKEPFDVFINHHGCDVKLNLASPIYHVLDLVGVKAFLDQKELHVGDFFPQAIEEAMRSASIHIAIFSRNYATSPWCLAELSFMVETGAPIIPVFYKVPPADLRWGLKKGLYAKAFEKYGTQNRYESEVLQKWKAALEKVSLFNGYEFSKSSDLGRLLRDVVYRVKHEIEMLLHVPVGLDIAVEEFEKVRSTRGYGNVAIVGIVGMPGIGKTTLAKELYNRNLSAYDTHSFLRRVKEKKLHELQKKLLEKLLHLTIQVKDEREGKSILAGRLRDRRVLVVLDDVGHGDQLDALLPEMGKTLGPGSLIIVTTEDSDVLRSCPVYKMRALDRCQAKKLFCSHAFDKSSPPPDFEDLVQQFIDACNGLPLSLKVIGATLRGIREKKKWKLRLEQISGTLPKKIATVLRASYDALEEEERNIFLDVACFFVGENKSLATAVWEAAGWVGLENLVRKGLVEVDKQNRLRMHNHLRDLGRDIATKSLPHRLGLWSTEHMEKIRSCREGIRGIMAATTQCDAHDEFPTCCDRYPLAFEKCINQLELLVIAGNSNSQDVDVQSPDLVWLRWFDFQHTKLPSLFSLTSLRVLELYGASSLQQLGENIVQPPKELREMIITATEGNKFESFPCKISGLERLTKIALISIHGKEFGFSQLPKELCDLQTLEHLELRQCKFLSSLPVRFGDLISLRHLDLSGCERLVLRTDTLQNITQLENLYLSGCRRLQNLPDQITKQEWLRELRLDNTCLEELPSNIGQLGGLEVLRIGSPLLKWLPDSLGNLSSLKSLSITKCHVLERLPPTLGNLKVLEDLKIKTSQLRSLPEGFKHLANLRTLKISDCLHGELDFGSQSSFSLKKLTMINLRETHVTRISISRHCCPRLETFILKYNDDLEEKDSLRRTVQTELPECEIRIRE